jgi:hypothetical protein
MRSHARVRDLIRGCAALMLAALLASSGLPLREPSVASRNDASSAESAGMSPAPRAELSVSAALPVVSGALAAPAPAGARLVVALPLAWRALPCRTPLPTLAARNAPSVLRI